jgi:hypothetical protein
MPPVLKAATAQRPQAALRLRRLKRQRQPVHRRLRRSSC